MGQYYIPVIVHAHSKDKLYSLNFGNGLKLMEHSYINNNFVNIVANVINGYSAKLFWVGDYAGPNDFKNNLEFEEIYKFAHNKILCSTIDNPEEEFDWEKDWYFINYDKKEFLLMPKPIKNRRVVNPIPLLTAVGNGRGNGDFYGFDQMNMIGKWAGDEVGLSNEMPVDYCDISEKTKFEIGE